MPELTPELTTEHRLSVIETDIQYIREGQDRLIRRFDALISADCSGNCDTSKELAGVKSDVGTYKKWTWVSFAMIVAAGLRSLF